MDLQSKVEFCVSRLVDNYEWQDSIEYDEWMNIQKALVFVIMGASNSRIDLFVNTCLEHGVIEEDE
jgi:hypothetical protein